MSDRKLHQGGRALATDMREEISRFALALQVSDSENAAEELVAHYRQLLDSGLPISCMDSEGRFLYISGQGAHNLGLAPADIVGKSAYDFFPHADADRYVARVSEVIEQDCELTFEDAVLLPNGELHWYWSVLYPLRNLDGEPIGVQAFSHDITKRKQAEQELAQRLTFEQLIAELASQLVNVEPAHVDAAINRVLRTVGVFMNVDRAMFFQFSPDYSVLNCTHEWHADGVDSARNRLQHQPQAQFPWIFHKFLVGETVVVSRTEELPDAAASEREVLLQHGVRSLVAAPIRVLGKTVGTLCFDNLLTRRDWSAKMVTRLEIVGRMIVGAVQRARAELELTRSQQFIEGITAASPNIVYVFDLSEARCVYLSSQALKELGRKPEDLYHAGLSVIAEVLHPEDMNRLAELLERWQTVGDDFIGETEIRLRHADGTWHWFVSRDKVFQRNADGSVRQIIGTLRDITDSKRAAEELQLHREKLVHVGRLSTMGEMVAGIAHEFCQPLYTILNFAKAAHNVVDKYPQPELQEAAQWMEQIAMSASRAGDMIHRFRDFSRRSSVCREHIPIQRIIDEATELVSFEIRRHQVQLERRFADEQLRVPVDPLQIQQVLVNLLQNALDAMSDTNVADRVLLVQAGLRDGHVEVAVLDRGRGLPDHLKVFDAFVTTKPDGLGMGLAICKTLVDEHGGKLWAEPRSDGGAAFHFTIPLAPQGVGDVG